MDGWMDEHMYPPQTLTTPELYSPPPQTIKTADALSSAFLSMYSLRVLSTLTYMLQTPKSLCNVLLSSCVNVPGAS